MFNRYFLSPTLKTISQNNPKTPCNNSDSFDKYNNTLRFVFNKSNVTYNASPMNKG